MTMWVGFGVLVLVMLAIDLVAFHRKAHEVSLREATIWSMVWIGAALLFNVLVWTRMGQQAGLEFFTGWVIEKSLSVDNLFVFVAIFSAFGIPKIYQHRVLFLGILGAIILRGIFIATGITLLNHFHWMVYLFGIFLIWTGVRFLLVQERTVSEQHPAVTLLQRFFPIDSQIHGQAFLVRKAGRLMATPLLVTLLVIEASDVVFAVDSIPAILAITRDPFLVYTSNIFAILGLRALYFVLSAVLDRFRYLKVGLSIILVFVGLKMLLSEIWPIPVGLSLGVIVSVLVLCVGASFVKK